MIRICEMVLPGHPDKFCDQIADAIIAECVRIDGDAYGQVEVATWSDHVWLNGAVCTRRPLRRSLAEVVVDLGESIGYTSRNWVDARKYKIESAVCQLIDNPARWSRRVNDQSIILGWAGYDRGTHFLAPEQFLAHRFRERLFESCQRGRLKGEGPDGKLMIRLREDSRGWSLEHILVTLQQREATEFMGLCEAIAAELEATYVDIQEKAPQWRARWSDVELMINPNGPFVNGGSDGDNGQTGRKLVMDFYGPRIPVGGGVLSGKHLSHIDRIGAYAARHAAVSSVVSGAEQCLVKLAYAPNRPAPIDVSYEMTGRGQRCAPEYFDHTAMGERYPSSAISPKLAQGTHFYDLELPWNKPPDTWGK